jgi:hypothetical protein
MSCAFFSTAAALAGSVVELTPLDEVCAYAALAIEIREIRTAWVSFIVVSPYK